MYISSGSAIHMSEPYMKGFLRVEMSVTLISRIICYYMLCVYIHTTDRPNGGCCGRLHAPSFSFCRGKIHRRSPPPLSFHARFPSRRRQRRRRRPHISRPIAPAQVFPPSSTHLVRISGFHKISLYICFNAGRNDRQPTAGRNSRI